MKKVEHYEDYLKKFYDEVYGDDAEKVALAIFYKLSELLEKIDEDIKDRKLNRHL